MAKQAWWAEDDVLVVKVDESGDPQKLRTRLKFIHDTGVNWDEQKKFIYPALQRPAGLPS